MKKEANIRILKSYSNIRIECEYSNIRIFVDILKIYQGASVFAQKPGTINTSMFAAPKLALVPAVITAI